MKGHLAGSERRRGGTVRIFKAQEDDADEYDTDDENCTRLILQSANDIML